MGSGFSRLVVPSCFKTAPENHHPDLIFSSSEPWDETLGHSFCYVRSSSPSHSSRRFLSPSHSLRLSETALKTRTAPSSETAFKSISGASVGANTSTPRTILQPDVIYQNATDPLARLNSSGFESSASFSSLPLQPVPRLCAPSDASGPLDRGFFMSGPIERGALSGPLDVATGGDIHFSAPLGGVYVKNRKKKGFPGGSVRKALSRSFSEKKRPWVVPVLNFVGRRDSTAAAEASDLEANSENVQWAHGKAGEDRVHVVVSEDHGWLFVGIYDGFNGPDAPEFLMGHLYRAVFNELEGLFWETIEEDSSSVLTQEEDNRILENAVVVDERNLSRDIADGEQDCCNKTGDDSVEFSECSKDLSPPPLSCGSVKRVTFESEQKMDSRRGKTLWEFLAEVDEDEGLDLSGSDRFSFSINNLFRVKNGSSVASRRSVLFSKLKFGASREKESQRKLFPCRFDWEEKEKIEVDNRVEEKLQRSLRRCKVGPADHDSVLSALSRALDITEVSYLEMTDKVLDRNPELALMGSCLLVVLMKDEDVYVMNVGDSRAIVAQYKPQPIGSCSELKGQGKDGLESEGIVEESGGLRDGAEPVEVEQTDEIMKLTALQLSMDHSTSIEEEVLRIKAEHPDDCQCIVNDRVKGRLKVTRAFGAGFLKQPKWNNTLLEMFRNEYIGTAPYITCSPSLCHHKLGPNDQFLVLSSDGLYQYLSNQEVVSHVENFMEKFPDGDPAQHLIEELLFRAARKAGMDFHELLDIPQGDRRKYHDDVTVMVISLEGRIWKSSGSMCEALQTAGCICSSFLCIQVTAAHCRRNLKTEWKDNQWTMVVACEKHLEGTGGYLVEAGVQHTLRLLLQQPDAKTCSGIGKWGKQMICCELRWGEVYLCGWQCTGVEEVLRIKAEHPDDCQCIVNDRVKGRLKVTRAFGAGFLKQPKWNNMLLEMFRNEYIGTAPYITCSPSFCHHKLGPNDQFLVLSSDGLYQYLSNQEVIPHVENFMEKFPDGDPAQHLIEELLFRAARKAGMDFHELLDIPQGDRRKYHDDVTVMVISLEGRIWKSSGKYV